MDKVQRPVADETRDKILSAAKTLFLEKGFDGASMPKIAQLAGVNKTLIFHHFKDKGNLWRRVKAHIIENAAPAPQYDLSSAEAYFKSILDYRFKVYASNPDLARLICWQQISDEHEALIGNDNGSPNEWLVDIQQLQSRGLLRADIDAKLIMLFIIYSSHAPFVQNIIRLNQQQIKAYKNIIVESCMTQFVVSGD